MTTHTIQAVSAAMPTVNSLSGGKTSSYMAAHYPADYNVFALVRIEAEYCKPKDESIVRYVSDKIGMDFIATAESDKTLYVMRDLEQMIGKEIIWVSGMTFEQTIKKKGGILPNKRLRFCTEKMKLHTIAEWWIKNINEKVEMRVGYRYDEIERSERFTETIRISVGKKSNGHNIYREFDWRVGKFPLIEDKVTHYQVKQWSDRIGLKFPPDSNCVGCFWKPIQQLRKNWEEEPLKMRWFAEAEKTSPKGKQYKWKKEMTYHSIKKIGLQQDFVFGTGSGCQAGFCTD